MHEIAVSAGEFLVGRAPDCNLPLSDPLISRHHAVFRFGEGTAVVEDLGSRNGVRRNGVAITKPEPLQHGDCIQIGGYELVYLADEGPTRARRRRSSLPTMQDVRRGPGLVADASEETRSVMLPPRESPGASLLTIGGVAEKALALGQAREAERLLQRPLSEVLGAAARGDIEAAILERAAGLAIQLATGTGEGTWIDYVFQLYRHAAVLLPARLVDELYTVLRRVKHVDMEVLRAYVARLRGTATGLGPAERFILQRIEGLERLAP